MLTVVDLVAVGVRERANTSADVWTRFENERRVAFARKLDIASTIALLNKEHSNNHLYVSLLEADPEARVADKVMPTLPISVMNVMEGMRGNQEMIVSGESHVDETATPSLDYVVSGAQLLSVTIK